MAQHNSLNLLEFIVDGEDRGNPVANGYSNNGTSTRTSKEYYDMERQAIIGATTSRSFSEFEMKKVCFDLNAKVKRCDPNAGFRGKKLLVQRSTSGSSDRTNKHSEFQRPFSAGYNRNSGSSSRNQNSCRAKSARIPRRRPFSASQSQSSRRMENSNKNGHKKISDSEWEELFPEDVDVDDDDDDSINEQSTQQQSKPTGLLSRKKQVKLKVFKMDPEMFYDGKLEQKYGELEELMACDFDKQKRKMIEQHLQQMNQLDERYRNLTNGRPSSAVVIPRSISNPNKKRKPRASTARRPVQKFVPKIHEYRNAAAGPSENMNETDQEPAMPQTKYGVLIDRTPLKQNDKIETKKIADGNKLTKGEIEKIVGLDKADTEAGNNGTPETRDDWGNMKVDHHIKHSNNDYLKKWLKEKDKLHWRKIREEKKKKKLEREKLIQEANEKLERKILSYQAVDEWMKMKNKEMGYKMKEQIKKENEVIENYRNSLLIPQQSLLIKSIDKDDTDITFHAPSVPEKLYIQKGGNCERKDGNRQGFSGSTTRKPPQARFMYKRPATAGNIKLNLEARGRSPVPPAKRAEPVILKHKKYQEEYEITRLNARRNSSDYEELQYHGQQNVDYYVLPRAPDPEMSAGSPREASNIRRRPNMMQAANQSYPFQNLPSQQISMGQTVLTNEVGPAMTSTHEVVEDHNDDQRVADVIDVIESDGESYSDGSSDENSSLSNEPEIQIEEESVSVPIDTKVYHDEHCVYSEKDSISREQSNNVILDEEKDIAGYITEVSDTGVNEGTKYNINISTRRDAHEDAEENAAELFVRLSCVEDVELLMEDQHNQNNRKPL